MTATRITDYLGAGPAASRPAAPVVPVGALAEYVATDTGVVSVWNGSVWLSLGAGSGGVSAVTAGTGLSGGTITTSGTIALAPRGAGTLMGNAGTVAATPGDITIGTGLSLSVAGVLSAVGGGGAGTVTSVIAGAGLNGGTITATGTISLNTGANNTWTAAQRGAPVTLTDAGTIATDMNLGNNFAVTLGGNRTLGNPTNITAGQAGQLAVHQDGTGSRTLAYASAWKFAGGAPPVLSTAPSALDILSYFVVDATHIAVSFGGNYG